jgi:hypothetical protein
MGNHGTQSYGTTGANDQIATMTPMFATPPEDVFLAFFYLTRGIEEGNMMRKNE